jgi:DNA-binding transcriptional regulator GbsR (MarR family)
LTTEEADVMPPAVPISHGDEGDRPDELANPYTSGDTDPRFDELVSRFVEHWGVMARSWGINASMGELFALLYITGGDWTAEELTKRLHVSRGNVSMNLRELLAWGVVRKVHHQGERREYFRAEPEVWTLFRRILAERKKRELDPTRDVLDEVSRATLDQTSMASIRERVESLRSFFSLIDRISSRMLELDPKEISDLGQLLNDSSESPL